MERLIKEHPNKKVSTEIITDGSLYQRAVASLLREHKDVNLLDVSWFAAKPCLFLCGGGHVSQALAQIASNLNFYIVVMDDREEFANSQVFPLADHIICDSFDHLENYCIPGSYYAVMTRGHQYDFNCVKTLLRQDTTYLGMMGSKLKVSKTCERLIEEGITKESLSKLHSPIGLSISAQTPEEIAISILAEIIQIKNKKSSAFISDKLWKSKEKGTLCIIIEKSGSAPRETGSMMLVMQDDIIDSIGGGSMEAQVIHDARRCTHVDIKEYSLDNEESRKEGMICGGRIKVLFLPV